jgi:hypothetical protein
MYYKYISILIMDILFERQKKQYDAVNNLFINKFYSIDKACSKIGISTPTYYRIKAKINDTEGKSKKKQKKIEQKGGHNDIIKPDENVYDDVGPDTELNQRIEKEFKKQSKIIDKSKRK